MEVTIPASRSGALSVVGWRVVGVSITGAGAACCKIVAVGNGAGGIMAGVATGSPLIDRLISPACCPVVMTAAGGSVGKSIEAGG